MFIYKAFTDYSFYNLIWLLANDLILGVAFSAVLIENSDTITRYVTIIAKVCPVLKD